MTTDLGLVVTNYVGVTMGAPAARKIARKAGTHGALVFGSESDDLPGDSFSSVCPLGPSWRLLHSEVDPGRDGSSLALRRDRVQLRGRVHRYALFTQRQAERAGMDVRYVLVATLVIDDWYELRVGSLHLPLRSTGLQAVAVDALKSMELDLFAGDLNMTHEQAAEAFPNRTVRGKERLHVAARPGIRLRGAQRLAFPPSDHPGVRVPLVIPNRPTSRTAGAAAA